MRPRNLERRVIAVGDVHGCAIELEELLKKIQPQSDDLFVFLGDYVDRGPYSKQVVDIILELKAKCDVVALKGNHEELFEDFLHRPESTTAGLFILNGGSSTLASYTRSDGSYLIPKEHIDFFENLAMYFETEEFFFVHAGVPEMELRDIKALAKSEMGDLLWIREQFLHSDFDWKKTIIHGHTPVRQIEVKPNRINLDTGCVFDGVLSALEVNSMSVFQVERSPKLLPPRLLLDARTGSRVALRFAGKLPVEAHTDRMGSQMFTTLNFNQFGLLLEPSGVDCDLEVGEKVDGRIGPETSTAVEFVGRVVRVDRRGSQIVYGIQLDRITAGADGRQWIDRPHADKED